MEMRLALAKIGPVFTELRVSGTADFLAKNGGLEEVGFVVLLKAWTI